jgi:hypothetical protein
MFNPSSEPEAEEQSGKFEFFFKITGILKL